MVFLDILFSFLLRERVDLTRIDCCAAVLVMSLFSLHWQARPVWLREGGDAADA